MRKVLGYRDFRLVLELMEGGRAAVEEEGGGQERMAIKRVRIMVQGSEASQSYVTQSHISSGQLGSNRSDPHGHTLTNTHSHNTYKCNLSSCGHGDIWLLLDPHTLC